MTKTNSTLVYTQPVSLVLLFKCVQLMLSVQLKAINNALDSKMVLKTHLFIKNISLSLQKLRQYNKSLTKHQTKINTAIITNQLK